MDNGAMVIYSFRDIRDVAVSAMRKFDMTFDDLIFKKWLEQAIDDYYLWTSMPRVMISRYESFQGNLVLEVRRIMEFLQIKLCDGQIQYIGEDLRMDKQKERIARLGQRHEGGVSDGGVIFDPVELLHWNHINEGSIGAWRSILTSKQALFLTTKFRKWLSSAGYSTDV